MIRLWVIECPNVHDQIIIVLCAFHSFLVEVQTNANAPYMQRIHNNNLEIRIAGDKRSLQ